MASLNTPRHLYRPVTGLRAARRPAAEHRPGGGLGIDGVGLAPSTAGGLVRLVDLNQFAATLRGVLDRVGAEGALFSKVEAWRQREVVWFLRWVRVNWWRWLTGIAVEHDRELATVVAHYRDRQSHRFPVAVVLVV